MCKLKLAKFLLPASVCLSGFIGVFTFLLPTENAQAQGTCLAALGGGLGVVDANGTSLGGFAFPVHIGDTIRINRFFVINSSISFETRNVSINAIKPNGIDQVVLTVGDIPPGNLCVASGGSSGFLCQDGVGSQFVFPPPNPPVQNASCVPFNDAYIVTFADIALSAADTMCNNQHPPAGTVLFRLRGAGDAVDSAGGPTGSAGVCADVFVPVIFPCITITKVCDNPCTPYGDPIKFHGQLCNTGNNSRPDATGN